jgi:hypothetical protein
MGSSLCVGRPEKWDFIPHGAQIAALANAAYQASYSMVPSALSMEVKQSVLGADHSCLPHAEG